MKGPQWYKDVDQLLIELHQDRQFEIFTAFEDKKNPQIVSYVPEKTDDDGDYIDVLEGLNEFGRGIWFTPNSMKYGKRKVEFIESFNAIGLDLDSGKEGDEKDSISLGKQDNLDVLLNLQLKPNVIIETKNGLQPMWFLHDGEITDNETHNSIQRMMQEKLGADAGAIGGERLYRLPGFYHWKDINDPFLCKLVHADYDKRYTLKELAHKFGGQRKLKDLRKKSVGTRFNSKPISIEDFNHEGNIDDIANGCNAFHRLESMQAPSHEQRLAMMCTYINLGNEGLGRLRNIAKNWNDYNPDYTEYMIKQGASVGYKPVTCQWMIERGFCNGKCANILDKKSPISFYFKPAPSMPNQFNYRSFIDDASMIPDVGHNKIVDKISKRFHDHGQVISDKHREVFQKAASSMSLLAPREKPLVIPFIPGGGKTSFIIEYLRYMTRVDPSFGAVLVVERQETIQQIADKINFHKYPGNGFLGYELKTAYAMLGYHALSCRKSYRSYKPSQCKTCDVSYNDCRVKYNFTKQKSYPVVIISHARLFEMSDRDDLLGNLRHWESYVQHGADDFEKIKHQRRLLILDEKPKLIDNIETNVSMWDQLTADAAMFTPDYADEVRDAASLVKGLYQSQKEYKIIDAVDENFKWSKEFIEDWKDNYLGDYPSYPTFLHRIITEGGLYNRQSNSISLTHYSNTYWGDYNTVIFDGTAMTDPDYRDDRFLFWDIAHLRPYTNLTINVSMEKNLSKTYYQKNPRFIDGFVEDIENIAMSGDTYVVAYKGYESEFEQKLKGNDNVKLEHWGNTKGRNDLASCKNIVCAGLLHKGESFYHSKDIAINGTRDDERSFDCVTNDRVRRFIDVQTETTKVYDFLTELIQDIFRTGLRNHYSDDEINVYLCTRDANLVNLLEHFFYGCKINRDWKPMALVNDREKFREFALENGGKFKTKMKLVRAFLKLGHQLESEDVSEVLNVDKNSAAKMLRRASK